MTQRKVYVVGGDYLVSKMFSSNSKYKTVPDYKDADLVCFTGGADVSPDLYGEPNVASSVNRSRDDREAAIFNKTLEQYKPMVGICRGAQFLNVMSGGKMWQDVDRHGIHGLHDVVLQPSNMVISVTSTHHQMMRPSEQGVVLGYAEEFTRKQDAKGEYFVDKLPDDEKKDAEIVWYPHTDFLCFQPHPEYTNCPKQTVNIFFGLIEEYLFNKKVKN